LFVADAANADVQINHYVIFSVYLTITRRPPLEMGELAESIDAIRYTYLRLTFQNSADQAAI